MKAILKKIFMIVSLALIIVLQPILIHAQGDARELRKQACETVFAIIFQCQLTAQVTESSCSEIAGILTSPETTNLLMQGKPAGAADALVNQTMAQAATMCKAACQNAKGGKMYKTAQEWIDGGGCTIQVTP